MLTRPIRSAAGPSDGHPASRPLWDTELLLVRGDDREGLKESIRALADRLRRRPEIELTDLASSLNSELPPGGSRLALVAATTAEAATSLDRALQRLDDPRCMEIRGASGLYYAETPLHPGGKIAFLFPGEGAQYLGMLGDVRRAFPEVAAFFDECDAKTARSGDGRSLTGVFLPPAEAGPDELSRADEELRRIDHAMISVMMVDWALHLVLRRLGLRPDVVAGHSMGELVALWAAGCIEGDDQAVLPLVRETMRVMQREEEAGAEYVLLAVGTGKDRLSELIAALGSPPVVVAMDNCPRQSVVVGPPGPMAAVEAELQRSRILFERLPFHRPYHTPLFAPMIEPVRDLFRNYRFQAPSRPVYSCTTARPFPHDPEAIRELAIAHWAEPVRFSDLIRNLYDDGVRLFIETGPRGNLSAFVEDILRGHPFVAMPANLPRRSGLTQLNHLLGALAAHNVPLDLFPLYEHRSVRRPDEGTTTATPPPEPAVRPGLPPDDPRGGGSAVRGVQGTGPLDRVGMPGQAGQVAPPPVPRVEASTGASADPEAPPSRPAGDHRARVMGRHLEVMERFLDHQREVTELFLSRPRPAIPVTRRVDNEGIDGAAGPSPVRPLLGTLTHHEPGRTLTMRRVLDLRDDLFAADHTVGGREISKVDPGHYGVPVMPMTFTLEMMAEAAAALVPGKVVTSVRDVKLYRWLAFDEEAPTVVELTARVEPLGPGGGPRRVAVEVRDLGHADRPKEKAWLAAQGTVVLDDGYPPSPPPLEFRLTEERPSTLSVERTYHNLFHGALFQGVRANLRTGDEGIESRIEVLPRDGLFRSISAPDFLIDPVLFDVVMHPLAAWHLVQPDQAGRIMLPIGVESLEVFGPPPPPGESLTARSWVTKADARSFLHQGEALAEDGTVRLRLNGVRCWRFYVPFGEVNFHGPKDQYFLSHRWKASGERRLTPTHTDGPVALVRLEPPIDLNQGSMLQVTAKVTLAPDELREYRRLEAIGDDTKGWLFDRNAAKDASRLVWYELTGERLFPSDIEVEPTADGLFSARRRGSSEQSYPPAAVARAGAATVAVSAAGSRAIGIAAAPEGSDVDGSPALDPEERNLLAALGGDPAEGMLRFVCARRAVAQATRLGPDHRNGPRIRGVRPGTGTVIVAVPRRGDEERWSVQTTRDGELIVAWTTGDREGS